MLTLYGFAASNYYNKVKLALMEKGIPFEESLRWPDQTDGDLSPLHKVPYMMGEDGGLCESQVIVDYLESRYPQHPLIPADPFRAAKVREIVTFLELHLELVARQLYAEAFFGGKISDGLKAKVREQLQKSIPATARLLKFAPYVAGDTFTIADCAAIVHFPLVSSATKIIYGEDLLAPIEGIKPYLARMGELPNVQKMNDARKENTERMLAYYASKRP
ncbi:glutathione S-transferase [Ralstonia solanacearum]|uniref:glutathione S-transferase n=1 Tax=Ralstonia solanacearum TaxID=305 RepID=UPI000445574B|nr:glutathione S-transferase [Ralstonia solanacearum]EUJ15272.1 glutathione S-transferase [Ralstonia solanacearum P673]MCL9845464.1 glutathione S-transferase [Ralstonia solanacearum]MCL9849696.1 glutathione S-transferase [Ralstonia solanacearum]MCL9856207.1 glutathione S-transferase [Ralstonia solanacearum]MCL9860024.1 glutathione S-transferase [Ralstonia solanacearum]